MSRPITAVVIDGFHKGHVVRMEYCPILKLLRPAIVRVDYCCDMSEFREDESGMEVYKECFRAVDQRVVLYSTTGESMAVFNGFFGFDMEVVNKPWTPRTVLKFGYHNEPIKRIEEDESLTPKSSEEGRENER